MKLRIGTRGSRLALTQSRFIARALESLGHDVDLVIIKTSGDERRDRAFGEIGAPGVFVRAIEAALLANEVDLAVHSHKDLPSESPEELVVAAIPGRADARDMLLVRESRAVEGGGDAASGAAPAATSGGDGSALPLSQGAVVGTASARRRAILADLRPDLDLQLIRGNLPTRMRLLHEERYDATLLACAGVDRLLDADASEEEEDGADPLPLDGLRMVRLDPQVFVPAPAQGAIAVQVRRDDATVRREVGRLDDADARRCILAERSLLARIEGGCNLPFGAWCRQRGGDEGAADDRSRTVGGELELLALLATEDGAVLRPRAAGADPVELADRVWAMLQDQGGK